MQDQIEELRDEKAGNTVDDTNMDYIAALKEMRENSVSKEKYLKLQGDNKRLMNMFVKGETPPELKAESPKDLNEMRRDLFCKENNNLEYCQKALALRDELIKQGQRDPFLPYGKQIRPTNEDVQCVERFVQIVNECIDYADGDSNVFTQELNRRTYDTPGFRFIK